MTFSKSPYLHLSLAFLSLSPLSACVSDDQIPAQETIIRSSADESNSLPGETISDLQTERVDSPVAKERKEPALTPDDIEADNDPMKIGFETAKWNLSETALGRIKDVAEKLKEDPKLKLKIDGHCDERGSDAYNQELSVRRAEAVRKQLVADGIKAARLKTQGFGRKKTLVAGHSEKVYSHNRRVEMIFSK